MQRHAHARIPLVSPSTSERTSREHHFSRWCSVKNAILISAQKPITGNCLLCSGYDNSVMKLTYIGSPFSDWGEENAARNVVSHSSLKPHRTCCDTPDMWKITRRWENDRKLALWRAAFLHESFSFSQRGIKPPIKQINISIKWHNWDCVDIWKWISQRCLG